MFEAQATFDAGRARLDTKAQQTHEEIDQRAEKREAEAKEAYAHALWLADSVFEASENAPRIACVEMRQQIAERLAAMEAIVAEAKAQTARFRQRVPTASEGEPAKGFSATIAYATEVACAADAQQRLRRLKIPGLFRGPILLVPAILLGIAAAAGGWVAGLRGPGLGVAAGAGVLLTAIGAVALWFVARKQVARAWQPLHRSSANLSAAADILIKAAEAEREQKERAAKQQLARERDAAHARCRDARNLKASCPTAARCSTASFASRSKRRRSDSTASRRSRGAFVMQPWPPRRRHTRPRNAMRKSSTPTRAPRCTRAGSRSATDSSGGHSRSRTRRVSGSQIWNASIRRR
jgi:hypothetical protein